MTVLNATDKKCGTCQSWHGERRYDARRGKVIIDHIAQKPTSPCSMNYSKYGDYSATSCRGYVRWSELP